MPQPVSTLNGDAAKVRLMRDLAAECQAIANLPDISDEDRARAQLLADEFAELIDVFVEGVREAVAWFTQDLDGLVAGIIGQPPARVTDEVGV